MLLQVCSCLGFCWFIEQPLLSTFEYFPLFRELLSALYTAHGGSAVMA